MDTLHLKVRYRRAKFVDHADSSKDVVASDTLENLLKKALSSDLGKDVRLREFTLLDDERHSLCLHDSRVFQKSIVFDVLHLDDRRAITTWKRPTAPVAVSKLGSTPLAKGDVNLQEPAYVMVAGNHLAVVERVGLRTASIESYINDLLNGAEVEPDAAGRWRLVPQIELDGRKALQGGVERIVLTPRAALVGQGAAISMKQPIKERKKPRKLDEYIGYGQNIFNLLKVLGANDADINKLRDKMSQDLVLKAKVEITVSKAERSTSAKLGADDIQAAFAHLAESNEVKVVDRDGSTNGTLTQLSHSVEVAHSDGIVEMDKIIDALSSAMKAWSAKGAIELK